LQDSVPAHITGGVLKKLTKVLFEELPHAAHNMAAIRRHHGFGKVNLSQPFLKTVFKAEIISSSSLLEKNELDRPIQWHLNSTNFNEENNIL